MCGEVGDCVITLRSMIIGSAADQYQGRVPLLRQFRCLEDSRTKEVARQYQNDVSGLRRLRVNQVAAKQRKRGLPPDQPSHQQGRQQNQERPKEPMSKLARADIFILASPPLID